MKKINPSKECCEKYEVDALDYPRHSVLNLSKICGTCRFNLFAFCWIDEYSNNNRMVSLALEGNDESKKWIYRKINSLKG